MKNEFNQASESFKRLNQHLFGGIRANDPKPAKRSALVSPAPREDTRWYGSAKRFEITYIVYSKRPADYDGYSIKELQDMVVKSGMLPDDKWEVLSGRTISRKILKGEEERTVIEIRTL